MLEKMKNLLRQKDSCVLATVSGNKPHCSLMAYVTDEECREIYMVTYKESTKYRNMTANPSVSLLVDTREEDSGDRRFQAKALTVNGTCEIPQDEAKKNRIRSLLLEKHPHLKGFADQPEAEVICIRVESFLLLEGIRDAYFETVK